MSIRESTLLYLIVFLLSCFITHRADCKLNHNRKLAAIALSLAAVFIPSLLAGMRGDSVGRDVLMYAVRTFEYAGRSDTFASLRNISTEPFGYTGLAFISSRFSKDAGFFLFTSQLMVICPVYVVAYKKRNEFPMWITMCVYLFVFYNNSLNIMKQSISAAFLLLCYVYINDKDYIKASIAFAVGMSFHSSAAIGLVFILFSLLLCAIKNNAAKISLSMFLLIIMINIETISKFLVSHGLLPEKYSRNIYAVFDMSQNVYLRIIGFNSHVFFDWIFRALLVLMPIIFLNRLRLKTDDNVTNLALIGLIFYTYVLVLFKTVYGNRISLYCDYFLIMLVPQLKNVFRNNLIAERVSVNAFIVGILGFYWYVWVMLFGFSASNYYTFRVDFGTLISRIF
ncbi:MAG: EpsG family protein [Ruminococcus sp.]|nr:EpsG family protein [Ruminococcus sp.]